MTKTCIICKDEFEAKRDDAKCCSPTCRKRYSRDKNFWDKRDDTPESVTDVPDKGVTPPVTDKCDKPILPGGVRPLDLPDGTQLSPVDVKKLSKDDLYDAIGCYQQDDWVSSPEFVELKRRLNKWDYKKLEEEGYKIPAWLYHKNNKNLNER